jgi:hypothetical protein
MLSSPTHCIVGATDLDAVARCLGAFGFTDRQDDVLPASAAARLYGLEGPARQATLGAAGSTGPGWIRVVETRRPAPRVGPYDHGPHAIDLYTRDIEASVALARAAGADCGEITHYTVGPLAIGEVKVVGPDHVVLVFIQVDKRRPSLLDAPDRPLHSELHSAVWTVPAIDAVKPFWTGRAGLPQLLDATIADPEVAAFMHLPRAQSPIRLLVVADPAQRPARLEFIEFPEDPGAPAPPDRPLHAGLYALGFASDDLARDMASLTEVAWSAPVDVSSRGVSIAATTGVAPGGVRVELWQTA